MHIASALTLSLPVTRICVNYSTVYNDTLVAKGLMIKRVQRNNNYTEVSWKLVKKNNAHTQKVCMIDPVDTPNYYTGTHQGKQL